MKYKTEIKKEKRIDDSNRFELSINLMNVEDEELNKNLKIFLEPDSYILDKQQEYESMTKLSDLINQAYSALGFHLSKKIKLDLVYNLYKDLSCILENCDANEKIDNEIRKKYRDIKFFNYIDVSPFTLSNDHFKNLFNKIDNQEKVSWYRKTKIFKLAKKIIRG